MKSPEMAILFFRPACVEKSSYLTMYQGFKQGDEIGNGNLGK